MIRLLLLAVALAAFQAPYQRDRLDRDRMDMLMERPLALLEAGDRAGAVATADAMIAQAAAAHGADSLEVADLNTAFGVQLAIQTQLTSDNSYAELALTYLARAIPIYRIVFGPDHPEVAIALNSWADVERMLHPDAPAAAEAALSEAYRIRIAALGPHDRETLWTILYLADLRGHPAMTGRDPARIEAVAAELERGIAMSRGAAPDLAGEFTVGARLRQADLYARNGQPERAVAALRAAQDAATATQSWEPCLMLAIGTERLLRLLDEAGTPVDDEALFRAGIFENVDSCVGPAGPGLIG